MTFERASRLSSVKGVEDRSLAGSRRICVHLANVAFSTLSWRYASYSLASRDCISGLPMEPFLDDNIKEDHTYCIFRNARRAWLCHTLYKIGTSALAVLRLAMSMGKRSAAVRVRQRGCRV